MIKKIASMFHDRNKLNYLWERISALESKLESFQSHLQESPFETHKILSNGEFLIVEQKGIFYCFPADQLNHALSYTNPMFDLGMRKWVSRNCNEGNTYVDIGANVGTFCSVAAKKLGRSGKILAFEPITRLERAIRQNVILNNPFVSFKYFPFALSDRSGVSHFEIFSYDNRVSTLHAYATKEIADVKQTVKVETRSLNELDFSVTDRVVIKIDAEGSEMPILKSIFDFVMENKKNKFVIALEYGVEHFLRSGHSPGMLLEIIKDKFKASAFYIDSETGEPVRPFNEVSLQESGNICFSVG